MKNPFPNLFHFSRAERAGAVLLTLVCFAAATANFVMPCFQKRRPLDLEAFDRARALYFEAPRSPGLAPQMFYFDPNTASADSLIMLGLPEKTAASILRYREKGGRFKSAADLSKIYNLRGTDFERLKPWVRFPATKKPPLPAPENFAFDPNTALEADLIRLGFPLKVAQRMVRYREKGGRFRKTADLEKIYGMPQDRLRELEPFVQIEAAAPVVRPAAWTGTGEPFRRNRPAPVAPVDINRSTEADWQQLPGIGPARSGQILRFRDRLGGFSRVEQVAETRGLPDSVFQRIKPWLLFSPPFRMIDLNKATKEELASHPYFSFKQAGLVVAYREQHGPYSDPGGIARIPPLNDPAWLDRIRPYLLIR